ncbi:MAG TPA: D-alanyl-lipoteichoic acid biosynthesis protein DltD [Oculatellaceae cyanobacterium]
MGQPTAYKKLHKSAALAAVLLFLGLNAGFSYGAANGGKAKNSDQNGVVQTIDSAVQQYKKAETPDVVLLGSSLIMSPVWTADYKKFVNVNDFYRHHRSYLLEKKLSAETNEELKVFSFAVPGAMVSDMDLIVDKMLTGTKKPQLVVYGVAPRDFMDDLAGGETKTATFQRLGDVSDLSKNNFAASTVDEKLELVFNRAVYLFGKRTRYQSKTDAFVRKVAHQAIAAPQDQFAVAANNLNVCPLLQDKKILWQKSLDEYHMRYQRFNQIQFKKQEQFLQDMLTSCKKNNIEVLLVNMPLTQTNLGLMPEGLYQKYLGMLKETASKNNVAILDLGEMKYGDECFYDTVHLNEIGAEPFLSSVSQSIHEQRSRSALASRAQKQI